MTIVIFFLGGLVVGSFLNVVIYRLYAAESFSFGRSHCPHCRSIIRWYDNIPLASFIILNAKCRDCKKKISWQYPLVELATGMLFALVGMNFFSSDDFVSWIVTGYFLGAVSLLIVIFVYDLLHMEIPDLVIWTGVFWVVVFNLILDWEKKSFFKSPLDLLTYSGVLGAVFAFSFFIFLVLKSKEKWMGLGDAYLVIFLGLLLGWPNIFVALLLSFSLGAIIGIVLVLFQKKKMKSPIPFAPFLVLGSIIAMFWGKQLISWYLNLLS